MRSSRAARDAYVQAETVTALAHQIRGLRTQRGWSQKELAQQLGTTQGVVSRLEDPSYGRLSLKTLFDLSRAFDTGLQVRFVSLVSMLNDTYHPTAESRHVPSFEEEAPHVAFYADHGRQEVKLEFTSARQPISVLALPATGQAVATRIHKAFEQLDLAETTWSSLVTREVLKVEPLSSGNIYNWSNQ